MIICDNMTSMESASFFAPHQTQPPKIPVQMNISNKQEIELLARLQKQIDYYFSPANLNTDLYLQQLLQSSGDHNGAVAVSAIADFPKIRELYSSYVMMGGLSNPNIPPSHSVLTARFLQLLCRSIASSDIVTLSADAQWIIPSNKNVENQQQQSSQSVASVSDKSVNQNSNVERTSIIVRDLPQNCTEQEVADAFTTDNVLPKAVRPDVGNTWYLSFDSESQAMTALAASQSRMIGGQHILARLKREICSVPSISTRAEDPTNTGSQPQRPPPTNDVVTSESSYSADSVPQQSFHQNHYHLQHQYPTFPARQSAGFPFPSYYHPHHHHHHNHFQYGVPSGVPPPSFYSAPPTNGRMEHGPSMIPHQVGYAALNYGASPPPPPPPPNNVYIRNNNKPEHHRHLQNQKSHQSNSPKGSNRKQRPVNNKRNSNRQSNYNNRRNSPSSSSSSAGSSGGGRRERREQISNKKGTNMNDRRERSASLGSSTTASSSHHSKNNSNHSRNRPNNNKQRQRHQSDRKSNRKKNMKMLSEEHFPALTVNKTCSDNMQDVKRPYAEALLKTGAA